mmetsp:Transcript_14626/g.21568  ORF Transcript_14626/g.21568 Transcript_14626/m.21568 type:complete len:1051 (+) Transcript_14626:463-3615(+)
MKIAKIALATLYLTEAVKASKSPYHETIRASFGQHRPTAADRLQKVSPHNRNLSVQRKAEASPPMPEWYPVVYPIIDPYPNPNDPENQRVIPEEQGTYRVKITETQTAIPFGEGPGLFPPYPKATKTFWEPDENGNYSPATQLWEVSVCPLADVKGYLTNPFRCYFGDLDGGSDPWKWVTRMFYSCDGDSLEDCTIWSFIANDIIPIIAEIVVSLLPIKIFDDLFAFLCPLFEIVSEILDVVGFILDAVGGIFSIFGGRRSLLEEGYVEVDADGHRKLTHRGIEWDDRLEIGDVCSDDSDCPGSWECFKISPDSDLDGVCVQTALIDAVADPASSEISLSLPWFMAALNKINMETDDTRIQGVLAAVTGLNSRGRRLGEASATRKNNESSADKADQKDQPKSKNDSQPEEFDHMLKAFLKDHDADIRKKAAEFGLNENAGSEMASKLLENASLESFVKNDAFKEKLAGFMSRPEISSGISGLLEGLLQQDVGGVANMLASALMNDALDSAFDEETNILNVDEFENIQRKLKDSARKLKSSTDSNNGSCDLTLSDLIAQFITEALTGSVATSPGIMMRLFALEAVDDAAEGAFGFSMPGGMDLLGVFFNFFFEEMIPAFLAPLVEFFQEAMGVFMFGEAYDPDDATYTLPSEQKQIWLSESSEGGDVYVTGGCDGNFEAELAWYKRGISFLAGEKGLLESLQKGVGQWFNAPVVFVQYVMNRMLVMVEELEGSCEFIGGWTSWAMATTTFENSRYILQEVACREVELPLKRGNGCDGLDNDCDFRLDECDEDVVPPEMDSRRAVTECMPQYFDTQSDADACFLTKTSVVDDCQVAADIVTMVESEFVQGSHNCLLDMNLTAVAAEGKCKNELSETAFTDAYVSSKSFTSIKVDSTPPDVTCGFHVDPAVFDGKGGDKVIDSEFYYTVTDACSDQISVTIDMFSNEIVEKVNKEEQIWYSEPYATTKEVKIFLENNYCNTQQGSCRLPNGVKFSRKYVVRLEATDLAGNVGKCETSLFVGNDKSDDSPLFLLETAEIEPGSASYVDYAAPSL